MNKTYKSKIMASVHEAANDLAEIGLLDKQTMRKFDDACLTKVAKLSPDEILEIRVKEQVSQAVLAHYLNVSPGIVSKWERGEKQPSGSSLKLLWLIKQKGLEAVA